MLSHERLGDVRDYGECSSLSSKLHFGWQKQDSDLQKSSSVVKNGRSSMRLYLMLGLYLDVGHGFANLDRVGQIVEALC